MGKAIIEYPNFGDIDKERFNKSLGLEIDSKFTNKDIVKGITKIIEGAIRKYITEPKIKINYKEYSNSRKWEFKKFEGYLAIYLKNNCDLTYTIRLNTTNAEPHETFRYAYFLGDSMSCYVDTLFIRILRDFSELLYEFNKLPYAFESCGDDVPRRTYLDDGSCFCNEHENKLRKPRHYYRGWINYEKRRNNQLFVGLENDFSSIEKNNPKLTIYQT